MGERKDLSIAGEKRHHATAIRPVEFRTSNRSWYWEFQCDCGNRFFGRGHDFLAGRIRSCGCLKAQLNKTRNIKHGKRYTRLYTIWRGMKARCGNPNAHEYENYGGRGIHVCAEWRDDFEAFFRWAMTHGYSANLTIDRINNDKGYAPDNCRWATMVEQRANQRRSICSKS